MRLHAAARSLRQQNLVSSSCRVEEGFASGLLGELRHPFRSRLKSPGLQASNWQLTVTTSLPR